MLFRLWCKKDLSEITDALKSILSVAHIRLCLDSLCIPSPEDGILGNVYSPEILSKSPLRVEAALE